MFSALGILIICVVIMFLIIPKLKREKETKTIWVFSILMIIGTALNIAIILNVKIPSPLNIIIIILKPISEFLKMTLLK